jgi:hypothetical protein
MVLLIGQVTAVGRMLCRLNVSCLLSSVWCMQQAWQEHGFSVEWAKEAGLDPRGLRFARDVRRQLEGITGPQGSHLLGTHIGLHRLVTPVCLH